MGVGAAAMLLPRPKPHPRPLPIWVQIGRGEEEAGKVPMRVPYTIAAEAARRKIYLPVVRR